MWLIFGLESHTTQYRSIWVWPCVVYNTVPFSMGLHHILKLYLSKDDNNAQFPNLVFINTTLLSTIQEEAYIHTKIYNKLGNIELYPLDWGSYGIGG